MDYTTMKTEQYQCQSFYDNNAVQNCTCGKCVTTEPYTKLIACPGECGGQATLYLHGSPYAGVWECDTCGTDTCTHTEYHVEATETNYFDIYGFPRARAGKVYICDDCETQVNVEEY